MSIWSVYCSRLCRSRCRVIPQDGLNGQDEQVDQGDQGDQGD